MRRANSIPAVICVLIFAVYATFRTQNYYWDGILSALTIEQNEGINIGLFNPNHLFGQLLGWILYWPLHAVWPGVRAHFILTMVSTVSSVLSCYVLFRILQRFLHNEYYSGCLTLLFAFSATWWKFSTDANVYVPSTFLLLCAAERLTDRPQRENHIAAGLLHAGSMLLHQIAILFYPAVLVAICMTRSSSRERLRGVLTYTAAAGIPVGIAYSWVWLSFVRGGYQGTLWKWITSNGPEEWAFASIGANSWQTLRSMARLFFGGRMSLALGHIDVRVFAILVMALVALIAMLLIALFVTLRQWFRDEELVEVLSREAKAFILVWLGVFSLFQFFWLTQFPYYRMFSLPACVLGMGLLLKRSGLFYSLRRTHAVPIFVVILLLSNFTFLIYPYSKAEASPPVQLALEARRFWKSDVVVYYREFNGDNAIHKYLNPATDWRPINFKDLRTFGEQLALMPRQGKDVWIDRTALDYITDMPDTRAWLLDRVDLDMSWGLTNRKHNIRFVRLVPKLRQSGTQTTNTQ